jgi:peptidoglycan/xylan/chitin deacetylase (PgdA/CDA1 family)
MPGGSSSAIIRGVLCHVVAPHVPGAAARLGIARTLPAGAGATGVAITFDDGPHPEGTPAVLELLAAAGAHAWFFLVGEQVVRRPSLAREIAAAGHVIAVHGFRHVPQPFLGARAVREDLARATAAIVDATGVSPAFHRPPYGVYSPAGLAAARSGGLTPLLWSRWGKDWRKFTTPRRIASRVLRDVRARDVILLHDADFYSSRDSHRRTAEALRIILRELNSRELDTVLPV